jgi:Zn-finger protein
MNKIWYIVALFVFIGLGLIVISINKPVPPAMSQNSPQTKIAVEESVNTSLPANYWDMPQATGKAHIGLENNMRPEACAQCHQAQFNAWRDSKHAHAYSPGLVGQFPDAGHGAGNDCLVCHAPLAEQLYRNEGDMQATLSTLLKNSEGFSRDADLDSKKAALPLRHAGVTCAVCHVRQGQRFGPPRRGSDVVGHLKGDAHGGFVATKDFEKSQFCASCHQFPQAYAINGKPLENTLFEWKKSRFAREGVQCQTCHMPDRKHAFKGIHDVGMVRSGLEFNLEKKAGLVAFTMTSVNIGHAFPTYVTPKIWVKAEALDVQGKVLQHWQWVIVREVAYDDEWKEMQDTRLMPGESRVFVADKLNKNTSSVRFYVDVVPDAFYKGVYKSLLSGDLQPKARRLIKKSLSDANKNDYRLYENELKF